MKYLILIQETEVESIIREIYEGGIKCDELMWSLLKSNSKLHCI